jgi:transposase
MVDPMFIEVEKRQSKSGVDRWCIKVCENVRIDGKPRKKHVRMVGVAHDPSEIEQIKRFAAKVIDAEIAKRNGSSSLFDADNSLENSPTPARAISDYRNLREEERRCEGIRDVFGKLFDDSGFGSLLAQPATEILKNTVLARIEEPASKRKTREALERDCGFDTSLDSIYRMMDKLEEKIPKLGELTMADARKLFDDKIDVVFFDVTTLYFESTEDDELRTFGFSKDQKFHTTQIVLALAVTREGLPIGYKVFPGNTAETKTLIACLDEWKKHISIGRVVFVADRAMFNSGNLKALDEAGYEFIVAATLRRMTKEMTDRILSPDCFERLTTESKRTKNEVLLKTIEHSILVSKGNKKKESEDEFVHGRLVITKSAERAAKDKKDRDRILEKMAALLGGKKENEADKLVSNKGYLKYAKFEGKKPTSIDHEKVDKDKRWDGIHGLFTNARLTPSETLTYYRQLWTIEETFRVSKSDIEMRPIYHFKKERIHAHIAICFMALYLVRKLQLLLARKNVQVSAERIQEELHRVQASHVVDRATGFRFRLPSRVSDVARAIYGALGLRRSTTPTPL